MPRELITSNQFIKEARLQQRRGKDLDKLYAIAEQLANDQKLAPRHRDHALTGNYKGTRECHIEPDWLLIYTINDDTITLYRTGTHADLF